VAYNFSNLNNWVMHPVARVSSMNEFNSVFIVHKHNFQEIRIISPFLKKCIKFLYLNGKHRHTSEMYGFAEASRIKCRIMRAVLSN
jgi:hypothetical protein